MRVGLWFLLLFSFVLGAKGQSLRNVSGRVVDDEGEALVNAVVLFTHTTDTLKQYPAVCDADGFFRQELPSGSYRFVITYLTERYQMPNYNVSVGERDVEIPKIVIRTSIQTLGEVAVVARRPLITYKGADVAYNLSALPSAVGGTLLDGIRQLPGVQVNDDSGLRLLGFYPLTIAVNGKTLRLSTPEVIAFLASMSVADADNVELIRHPGPEYGHGVEAVLNIVTKRKPKEGFNTFVSSDVIYRRLWSENLRARVNYNQGISKNYASYNFFDNRRMESLSTSLGADTTRFDPHRGHGFQLGTEWAITSEHQLGIRTIFNHSQERISYNDDHRIAMTSNVGIANLYHVWNVKSFASRLSLDYTQSRSDRGYTHHKTSGAGLSDRFLYLRGSWDGVYRYTPSFSTLAGVEYSYSLFRSFASDSSEARSLEYQEGNMAVYLTAFYRTSLIDSHLGLKVNADRRRALGYESLTAFSQTFSHWLPYFSFAYNISDNHRLSVTGDTYYQRPSFRDLLPYVSSSSSFLYRRGNPYLKSSTRYNLSLGYLFMKAASVEINLSSESLPIVEYIVPHEGRYYIDKANLESSRYFRVVAGTPIPIINKENGVNWLAITYAAYHRQTDKGMINGKMHHPTFDAYYVQHKHSLTFPDQWYLEAQITYYSPLLLGVYKTEKQWWIDATLSKRWKNWKFTLHAYDLLNSNVARGEIVGLSAPVCFTKEWYSPKVTLGVSFVFGNKDLKSYSRRSVSGDGRISTTADEGLEIGRK